MLLLKQNFLSNIKAELDANSKINFMTEFCWILLCFVLHASLLRWHLKIFINISNFIELFQELLKLKRCPHRIKVDRSMLFQLKASPLSIIYVSFIFYKNSFANHLKKIPNWRYLWNSFLDDWHHSSTIRFLFRTKCRAKTWRTFRSHECFLNNSFSSAKSYLRVVKSGWELRKSSWNLG